MEPRDLTRLPRDLPLPEDDGAADGLEGLRIPDVRLASTLGLEVDLHQVSSGRLMLYVYPRTGTPGKPSPPGWDQIPGARGCTPENCAFRDHERELRSLGAAVIGLSSQPLDEQREFAERERISYPLVNEAALERRERGPTRIADPLVHDSGLVLARELCRPTFAAAGMTLYKRLTLIAEAGTITKAFYPVFPPDRHPEEVIAWLRARLLEDNPEAER